MKVIIFAGGWGTRLGQLSEVIPKPMVLIGNRPILWHIMKYYSSWGFNEFIILLGVKGHIIKEYFYNFEAMNNDFTVDMGSGEITYHTKHHEGNWKVTLIDTGLNNQKGSRLKQVESLADDDINMLTYGDGLADVNLINLLKFHKTHGKMVTITGARTTSRFGELDEIDGRIMRYSEKPKTAKSYINGGFAVFNKDLFDYLALDPNCDLETQTYRDLAKMGEMMVYKHEGSWECMDHERDVTHLNFLWNTGQAFWNIW